MSDTVTKTYGWFVHTKDEKSEILRRIPFNSSLKKDFTHSELGIKGSTISRLIDVLYSIPGCECGGGLHVVVDDFNVRDCDLEWCLGNILEEPEKYESHFGVALAILYELAPLSEDRREAVVRYHDIHFKLPEDRY